MGSNSNQTFRGKSSPDLSGVAYLKEYSSVTNPGNVTNLLTDLIGANTKINLLHLAASCRHEAIIRVKIDGLLVASIRTGAGNNNADFYWVPIREVLETETLVVEFESMAGKPITGIEIFLHGREVTT